MVVLFDGTISPTRAGADACCAVCSRKASKVCVTLTSSPRSA